MERYIYLGLLLFTLSFPLVRSFEPRLRFWRTWPGLFTGIAVMCAVFIPWDIAFTRLGVWGFNPRYLAGPALWGLPLEEWSFFVVTPYACLFIHEALRHFVRRDVLGPVARPLLLVLAGVLLLVGLLHLDRLYTSITFLGLAGMLLLLIVWLRVEWLGRFLLTYAVSFVPFSLVNGVLTGWLLQEPVVWYNDAQNLGLRLNTIPVEDSMYLMLYLLIVTLFHERHLKRPQGDLPPAG